MKSPNRCPTLYLVAHGDHNFKATNMARQEGGWLGHLDNQAGVYLVMSALFTGQLPKDCCCVEITYGQESKRRDESGKLVDFEGAR